MTTFEQLQEIVIEINQSLSQEQISELTGVPQSTISKIKTGVHKNVSLDNANKLHVFYKRFKKKTPVATNN